MPVSEQRHAEDSRQLGVAHSDLKANVTRHANSAFVGRRVAWEDGRMSEIEHAVGHAGVSESPQRVSALPNPMDRWASPTHQSDSEDDTRSMGPVHSELQANVPKCVLLQHESCKAIPDD